jgi:hypothetical protein
MAEVVVFDIDAQSAIQKLAELRASTAELKKAQAELAKEVKDGNAEAAKSYEVNAILLKNVANEQRVLSRAVEGYSAVQKSVIDTTNFANNSIQENRDLLKQLTATYIGLKNPTKEQTEQIRKLSDQLKEQESAIGNNVRNVGNYQGALKDAVFEIKIFGTSLNELQNSYNNYSGALKDAKVQLTGYITGQKAADGATKLSIISTAGLSAAMNVLRLALIATGIGAFVVLLGSLVAAFATTERGADLLEDALANVTGVVKSLFGEAQKLGVQLIDIFSNPKKSIKELVDFLQGNLLNRLKSFGVILDGILERDTKKITNGIAQLGTGVENLTDKLENGAKKGLQFLSDSAKKQQQIVNIQRELEDLEGAINKRRAENATRETELLIIAKSVNSTQKERKAATDEILKNTAELQKLEEDIVKKKIEALKLTQSQNITDREGNKELQDLEAELIKVQAAGKDKQLQLIKLLNKENKDRIDNIKKSIPLVEQEITGYDELESKLKKIEDASKAAQEEAFKLLQTIYEPEEFFEEGQDAFDRILSNFEKFKLGLIDTVSEKDIIGELTGLDEKGVENVIGSVQVITGAVQGLNDIIGQSIANRQDQLQQAFESGKISEEEFNRQTKELALKEFRRQKAFNLVQATMDTIKGAISAYASTPGGPIIKGIAAAIATTFGVAQTAVIAAQQPPKFAEGGEISIDGKSHAQGGEIVTVGGRAVAEVEGGEGLYVMKKNAYQKIKQFSAINEAFGGKSWLNGSSKFLADGGAINTTLPILESRGRVNNTIEQNRILSEALRQLPAPVLSIKEFEKKQAVKDKSVRIAEL